MQIFNLVLVVGLFFRAECLDFTVSGFSSGGFFAQQLNVAHSASITGAAILAGGPYNCALGSVARTPTACTINPYLISLQQLTQTAVNAATNGLIDNVNNLVNNRVYIYSGLLDTIVPQSAVKVTEQFYRTFIPNDYLITTVYNISAEHAFITDNNGNPCWYNGPPAINNCNFDLAGNFLQFLLGNLAPKVSQIPSNLVSFDQSKYADVWKAGMSSRGWMYLPRYCVSNVCKVHLSFHGCSQDYDKIGIIYVKTIGVNEWAEANNIIVIYPQTTQQIFDHGCWDFWGYTGADYLYKSGLQIQAVYNMAQNPPYVTWTDK